MKKLLLTMTMIPAVSFAAIDNANVQVYGGSGFVNSPIVTRGVYDVDIANTTAKERTYHYKYMLCPAEHNCEEHESKIKLKPHSSVHKNYQMDKYIKYSVSGNYKVDAIMHVWCGDEDTYVEESATIKVLS